MRKSPLAHVGKIKTKDGLKEGLIDASQFRLPWCWAYCDKLLLAEISDFQVKESFRGDENSLYMPKSDLVMEFDVRGTFAVARDEGRLEKSICQPSCKAISIIYWQFWCNFCKPGLSDICRYNYP